jgi:hypothetical protein
MALIVCYTVLHGKLIFVQSLREIFRSLIRQWHGREENAMTIYIYIYIYIYPLVTNSILRKMFYFLQI